MRFPRDTSAVCVTLCLILAGCNEGARPKLPAAKVTRPPNVVFILADDYGWADLHCYGSTFYQTPNLDNMARQGLRFTDAYAACPVCSPTRASILTGRYPARLHLTDWLPGRPDRPDQKLLRPKFEQQLPLDEITLAEALKPAGYVSASIGKWHLGGPGFWPEEQGFDVNVGGWTAGSPRSYFSPYMNPKLPDGPEGEYLTDRLTDEAINFIEQNKDRRFFLYLPHYAVHIPLGAKEAMIEKYRKLADPANPQHNPIYAAMIQSLDEGVGRILKKLDELKLSGETLVIFTSDNGGLSVKEGANTPATSNAPLRAGKGYLYEGGIREPLIVRWPGVVQPGRLSHERVISTDYFPTILQACGVNVDSGRVLDGVSLLPLLQGTGPIPPRDLFWHYPHYANQGGHPGGVVRSGDWKLIEFYEDNHLELYNVKDDIGEMTNRAAAKPDLANELRQKLHAWRESVGAQMTTPNPNYDPNWKPPPTTRRAATQPGRKGKKKG